MMSDALHLVEAIPSVIKKIREIKNYPQSDLDLTERLLKAEEILESLNDGLEVPKIGIEFSKSFELELTDPEDPSAIKINNKYTYKFDPIRLLMIRGITSSLWGIYDDITRICHILLGSDQDKNIPQGLLEFLLSNETKIPNSTLGPLRQKYKYALSLSYQLRNSAIHRLPIICGRINSFLSNFVNDGFIIKAERFQEIIEFCKKRDKITSGEISNNNFITNQNQCLIKLIETLQLQTDKCALELLEASIKPLLPTKHIYE